MYRTLVTVDRKRDRAFHQAKYVERLASEGADVEATVLHVVPPGQFEEVDAAVEAAEHLEDAGVSVDRVAVGGEVAETLLDTAENLGVDGIVIGGRKRSGVQKVVLGSVAMDLMLSAERPVTLTG